MPAGRGRPGAEREGEGDGPSLAEAADDRVLPGDASLPQEVVDEVGGLGHALDEGLDVGPADLLDHVPVASAGRDPDQGRAGRQAQQPALGVERVEQGVQVRLAGGAAVQQHDRALGLAGGLADQMGKLGLPADAQLHAG